ncbi:hypothetical protein B0T18DRAFT_492321 [Schizothecium vesticola]|uniref:Myb-like domain-containing protein n=1 Tax=Schizothecium vesticola TaxID=314040 RepID=A0AA40BQ35_9PEZI|nr:hypothetical protein B0T18DRAFT_492321 [Schizothecium vesticola]
MSMLNKKAGFRPKLGPKLVNRRPDGPPGSSQSAGRISSTPAPTTTSADAPNATPPQAQPPPPSPARDPAPQAQEAGQQDATRPPSRGRTRGRAVADTATSEVNSMSEPVEPQPASRKQSKPTATPIPLPEARRSLPNAPSPRLARAVPISPFTRNVAPPPPPANPTESSTAPAAPSSSAAPAPRAAPKPKPVRGRPSRRSQASATEDEGQPTATPDPSAPASAQPNQSIPGSADPATTAPTPAARGRKRKAPATAPADAEADGETQAEEESQAEGSSAQPKKRARAKRVVLLPGDEGYQTAAEKRAAARRRARNAAAAPEDGEEGVAEGDADTAQPKRRTPVRQRELTPEDAEAVEIDQTQVKMAELIKDMRVGKKFSRHDELMERERAKRQKQADKKKQQQQNGEADDPAGPSIPAAAPDAAAPAAASPPEPLPLSTLSGPRYIIVDGELVVDQSSLRVDRHARARREAGDMEVQEENEFTHQITSATYLRRTMRPQQWDDAETDKLYWALSMFGTDFETIARMFPGKTRKHVKLKFNREERAAPDRIREALVGRKTVGMDMDAYQKHAGGAEYETAEAIYAEQKRAEEEFEAQQARLREEREEEARKRREAMFGAGPNAGKEGDEGGEGGKKKKGKGRGRKKAVENTW